MTKVMVFGTFDVIHQGHLNFFRQAKKLGDYLIVVIACDRTVEKIKGQQPIYSETIRKDKVLKTGLPNEVIMGNYPDPYQVIVDNNPDIVALGYDQNSFTDNLKEKLEKRGIKTEIVRLNPYHPEKFKSSLIKKAGKT